MSEADELTILSSNNTEIYRHLGAVKSKQTNITHHVASDGAEIQSMLLEHKPDVVLLDANLPDGSGYELCRKIKDSSELGSPHVILLQSSVLNAQVLAALSASGCDDVLALPIHSDDFYYHLSQVTGVPLRVSNRVPIDLKLQLVDDQTVSASVENVSTNGLGLYSTTPIETGTFTASLVYDRGKFDNIKLSVKWCRPSGHGHAVGAEIIDLPLQAKHFLRKLSLYEITKGAASADKTVELQGRFDEHTDFDPLYKEVSGAESIEFVMQNVNYLSSSGVRAWCIFLGQLPEHIKIRFRNCSVSFTSQAAMVPSAIGHGVVVSVQAPYYCSKCDREDTRLVETALVLKEGDELSLPVTHCQECSAPLEFDDLPERYFAFLMD